MKKLILVCSLLIAISVQAQSEMEAINKVLYHYIEGTANGEPDRLKTAFDENGDIVDEDIKNRIDKFTDSIIKHTEKLRK